MSLPEPTESKFEVSGSEDIADGVVLEEIFDDSVDTNVISPSPILSKIIMTAINSNATDVHIPNSGRCHIRKSGILRILYSPNSGEPFELFDQEFSPMLGSLQFTRGTTATKRCRWGKHQFRILYLVTLKEGKQDECLILRVQSLSVHPLSDYLSNTDVIDSFKDPHGLILVVGMIGSGKTSLATSICSKWLGEGKHIFKVEDPTEYILAPGSGRVTQISASLTDTGPGTSFDTAALLALRADIDALFIGECRSPSTFKVALEAATTHEPCITTLHSGGFADAIARCRAFASRDFGDSGARFALSQAFHSILHITLAFDANYKPIPVVAVLPFWSDDKLRGLVYDEPVKMLSTIKQYMSEAHIKGLVNYNQAAQCARDKGATEISIRSAMAFSSGTDEISL